MSDLDGMGFAAHLRGGQEGLWHHTLDALDAHAARIVEKEVVAAEARVVLSRVQGRIDAYAHALRRQALTVTRLEGVEACLDEANKLDNALVAQAEEGGLATTAWKNMSHELPPLPADVVLPF